jgi:hypothetical protein
MARIDDDAGPGGLTLASSPRNARAPAAAKVADKPPVTARPQPAGRTAPRAAGARTRKAPRKERIRLWLALLPRHWLAVGVIVAVLLVGIPLAHAMVGDLGALLMLAGVGGFALGRATAKHDLPGSAALRGKAPPRRKG